MAPMLANSFFYLLFLATVANCPMEQDHPMNVTASIQSEMGAGTKLRVECTTKFRGRGVPVIDLGEHQLGNWKRYSFTLVQPYPAKLDRQINHCTFNAQGYIAAVVGVYWGANFPYWKCECVQGSALCGPSHPRASSAEPSRCTPGRKLKLCILGSKLCN